VRTPKKIKLSTLIRKLDKIFSEFVRQRDADLRGVVECCTCKTPMLWKKSHCGHFMSRGHQSTRYDEKNTAVQCPSCNSFDQGKQYEFALYLDKRYGPGTADKMLMKSKMTCKRDRYDLECLIAEYKNKLKKVV